MTQITLEEAETQFARLIREALQGEEIIITENSQPVARLQAIPQQTLEEKPRARFGSAKDLFIYMAEDFDETPEEFKEYL